MDARKECFPWGVVRHRVVRRVLVQHGAGVRPERPTGTRNRRPAHLDPDQPPIPDDLGLTHTRREHGQGCGEVITDCAHGSGGI